MHANFLARRSEVIITYWQNAMHIENLATVKFLRKEFRHFHKDTKLIAQLVIGIYFCADRNQKISMPGTLMGDKIEAE